MEPIAAYAQEMSDFLKESELTGRRAFIETFVKEIVVMPGDALVRYTIPMPDDNPHSRQERRGDGAERLSSVYRQNVGLDGLEPTTSVLSVVWSKTNRNQATSATKCQVHCLLFGNKTVVNYALTGGSSRSL